MSEHVIIGVLFWLCFILVLLSCRPGSKLHRSSCNVLNRKHFILIFFAIIVCVFTVTKVMSLPPNWNGEIPDHKDQYERITESFLHGHLYFEYDDIDPKLLEMENPYDREARDQQQVQYHWDHAFYNGHYYMYFGVVPVFLLFLPFRVIFGYALPTLYATQIFATGFILGVFSLFWNLTKRFFKELPLSVYLALSLILSIVCLRYTIKFPILYHTAISAGLCLEIWSLFFFTRAVWMTDQEDKALFFAFLGSLLGALVFGCRPTIAVGNLAAIPLLIIFLKSRKITFKFAMRLIGASLPYVVVLVLLTAYNQARFGNPLEFGQSYQLTIADQSSYGSFWERLNPIAILNGIIFSFADSPTISVTLSHGGVLWECPVLLLGLSGILDQKTKKQISNNHLTCFMATLFISVVLIIILQTVSSPKLLRRYSEDYLWLLAILVFLVVGFCYQTVEKPERYAGIVCWFSIACFFVVCLIFLIQEEGSLTATQPEVYDQLRHILTLGFK